MRTCAGPIFAVVGSIQSFCAMYPSSLPFPSLLPSSLLFSTIFSSHYADLQELSPTTTPPKWCNACKMHATVPRTRCSIMSISKDCITRIQSLFPFFSFFPRSFSNLSLFSSLVLITLFDCCSMDQLQCGLQCSGMLYQWYFHILSFPHLFFILFHFPFSPFVFFLYSLSLSFSLLLLSLDHLSSNIHVAHLCFTGTEYALQTTGKKRSPAIPPSPILLSGPLFSLPLSHLLPLPYLTCNSGVDGSNRSYDRRKPTFIQGMIRIPHQSLLISSTINSILINNIRRDIRMEFILNPRATAQT